MDEKTKQRIVGIVVITALLAIFLPMLFDDPVERSSRSISEMQIPDLPKQFQPRAQPVVPSSTEQVLKTPVKARPVVSATEKKTEQVLPAPVKSKTVVAPAPKKTKQKSTPIAKSRPVVKPVPKKITATPIKQKENTDKLVRWVIQVGSFKEKKNAAAERDKLRKQGFVAFVESFNDMYRVRVGPELNKAKAQKNQRLLEKKNAIKTLLISE